MTAAPLSAVPAPRLGEDAELTFQPGPRAPQPVTQTSPEDAVMLPRHIADAAYHVLQAIHALKDNGSYELFQALGKALDKGKDRGAVVYAPPCEVCHVDVFHGLPHSPQCTSDEAVRYRTAPLPVLDETY
ncbi:MAG: hypothetical protein JWP11_2263 [Frankiales bacterium]|jgi:hypothetical protein|nr:hypothetical protein [Frankiales bacterium]